MKRTLSAILLMAICSVDLMAQQIPLYSQYYLNPFVYNPARTGDRGNLHANLSYRTQWTSVSGAPETYAATLDGSIKEQKAGFGALFYSDNISFFKRFGGYLSYAYHIKIGNEHRLSLGLSAGVLQTSIDLNAVKVNNADRETVLNNYTNGVGFDASAGINYNFKGLNIGFAVPQLFQTNLNNLSKKDYPLNYQLARHYLINASYNINIKDSLFFIEPLVFARITSGNQFQFDAGAKFQYKNLVWIGLLYRYGYAFTPGVGFNVHDKITLGYSYDFALNDLKSRAGQTHEAFIGIKFGKSEDKGIIETIKQLQQRQDLMDQKIDKVVSENDSLKSSNDELKKTVEDKDAEIAKLKADLENKLKEFQQQMANQTPPVKVDIPKNAIYEGKKEDLEFIDGDPGTGYFMVVAATKTEKGARQEQETFKKRGHDVGIVLNKRRSWYYLYLSKEGDFEQGIKDLYKLREQSEFKDAWIHIYK
jgi:type IX secretion system PorP/SprF family membrane protein